MGRLFAASDIHGHGRLLLTLLEQAGYEPGRDRLYLLGDYVNKGPDSIGTLETVRHLCRQGAVALQGNNDRAWLQAVPAGQAPDSASALRCQRFIASLPLWAQSDGYLFVHAGIRPGVPLYLQTAEDLTEIRTLFYDSPPPRGMHVVFGHTPTFRFGLPPGEIWHGEGKTGIDTGAGRGLYLSLVELTGGFQWRVPAGAPHAVTRTRLLQAGWAGQS